MIKNIIPVSIVCLTATSVEGAGLLDYDAAIVGSGFESRTTAVSAALDGTNSVPFDFGAISGDATFEFILAGDPVGGGQDGYLAVDNVNITNSLRYEQWNDTGQLGFTKSGVVDNTFTAPNAASPIVDTHVTYRWTQATGTMDLFINGAPTDSIAGATFDMPTGPGILGNNAGLSEGMVGTISRVTTFNSAIADSEIAAHAIAFTGVPEPSSFLLSSIAALALLRRNRR